LSTDGRAAESLGLVCGSGVLPRLAAQEARRAGWRVLAFVLGETEDLAGAVDRIVPWRVGEVGPVLRVLVEEGIRHVVLAGRVRKDGLFRGMSLDDPARDLVRKSREWTDDGLLTTAAEALAGLGIEVLDQRRFLGPWLAPAGAIAGPAPGASVEADIARGMTVAADLARHRIGQTVVVRAGVVVAVEGMEGTDDTIRRGLGLAGPGAVVVKATRRDHDYRFDVPTVGVATVTQCLEGGAAALAVEAGRVALLDREEVRGLAAQAGISVVGVASAVAAA
jgi:hypothetical protein